MQVTGFLNPVKVVLKRLPKNFWEINAKQTILPDYTTYLSPRHLQTHRLQTQYILSYQEVESSHLEGKVLHVCFRLKFLTLLLLIFLLFLESRWRKTQGVQQPRRKDGCALRLEILFQSVG